MIMQTIARSENTVVGAQRAVPIAHGGLFALEARKMIVDRHLDVNHVAVARVPEKPAFDTVCEAESKER